MAQGYSDIYMPSIAKSMKPVHSRFYIIKSMKMTVGDRVKIARKAAGLTQDQLAERAGMKQPTLNKLERGGSVSSKRLVAIAEATGYSAQWLDTGKGNPRPPSLARPVKEFLELTEEDQERALRLVKASKE